MVPYILAENPGIETKRALELSKKMTDGEKFNIFLLQLSFIGWSILGALCFGIGSLWVSAYSISSTAIFYDELVANDRGYFTVPEPAEEVNE